MDNPINKPAVSGRFLSKIFSVINRERDSLIWGFGFATDFALLYQGQHENGFITYGAAAALSGNALRLISSGVGLVRGREASKTFDAWIKPYAATVHHTSGMSLMCSGLDMGATGFSPAEIVLGLCSTAGSVMQFRGNDIIKRLNLRDTRLFKIPVLKHADGGKVATFCYLPEIPSVFQDAWRLQSPALVAVGCLSSAVIALLFIQGKGEKPELTATLPTRHISPEDGPGL